VTLIINLKVYQPLQGCIVGFICDKNGNEIIGSNTFEENFPIGELEPEIDQVFNSNLIYR